ncbi:MAG TPA: PQQ-binding-like beta-propeller repeat protein [Feifaniaceae bacterium]|nr:PQQ-binding-like beta-propeller repeat protein [Feifaniaceae bacterium]
MRRSRRGRQLRRSRTVNWKRFLLFIIMICAIVALVLVGIQLLSGKGPLEKVLPIHTPTPAPGESLPEAPPTPTPVPTLAPDLPIEPVAEADPGSFGFSTGLMIDGQETDTFDRGEDMRFGDDKAFTALPGLVTFGGSNYRNTFTYGTQTVAETSLTRIWEKDIGSLSTETMGTWTGTGWTGMPLIVEWPAETRKVLGVYDEYKNKDGFVEVIYCTMDGHIYFLELESGNPTRDPINLGVVTKGTASIDPRGYPLLYTGQGITSREDGVSGAWFRIIDLIQNKVVWKFGGKDAFSYRAWQAYDSSALVNAATDTIIAPGENGVFYTFKLNSSFDASAGAVSVNPGPLQKYRYKGDGYGISDEYGKSGSWIGDDKNKRWVGIENSVAAFRNYAFFTDNGGRLQCLDLNTLKLQYVVDVTDDSDVSIVIEEDVPNQTFYLYTANEVDKQPGAADSGKGMNYHRKIDGRTGKIIWQKEYEARFGNTSSNGGTLGTPHVGRGNISDLVIYNSQLVPVTYTQDGETKAGNGGRLIAYSKESGEEVWRYEQYSDFWSSPVVIYDESGDAYVLQCDRNGMMRMFDARTGELLNSIDMGSRIESTPAVFGDYLVVGTRGMSGSGEGPKILGIKIG